MNLLLVSLTQCLGFLALEATLVFALGFLLQHLLRPGPARRTLWQSLYLCLICLGLVEATGLGPALALRRQTRLPDPAPATPMAETNPTQLTHIAIARSSRLDLPATSVGSVASFGVGSNRFASAAPVGRRLVQAWLLGVLVGLGWLIATRAGFVWLIERRPVHEPRLHRLLELLQSRLGLRRRVRLTESDGLDGPIAHGLFRREITLPPRFVERFGEAQRSAMLAHELAHLATRDPHWQLLSDFLTVCWWWHPLAWWARRAFQEACETSADEASLVVEGGPEALAECLVLLGRRLTRSRLGGALGVSGKPFRSGLGRRVTRLELLRRGEMRWRPAQSVGRRLARAGGMVGLGMISVAATALARAEPSPDVRSAAGPFQNSLIALAWGTVAQIYTGVALTNAPPKARTELKPPTAEVKPSTPSPHPAQTYLIRRGDTLNSVVAALRAEGRSVNLRSLREANPKVNWQRLRVGQEIRIPAQELEPPPVASPQRPPEFASPGVPAEPSAPSSPQAPQEIPRPALKPLPPVADGKAIGIDKFANADPPPPQLSLQTRWFRLPEAGLRTGLRNWLGQTKEKPPARTDNSGEALTAELRRFLATSGVDLAEAGRQCIYNERDGLLLVRATPRELQQVEEVVQHLNTSPAQITVEAKFCEIAEEMLPRLRSGWAGAALLAPVLRDPSATPGETDSFKTILTEAESRVVVRALEQQRGVDVLTTPRVTTLSGRQAQIKSVRVRYVVTDLDFSTNAPTAGRGEPEVTIQPLTKSFELGPILDLVPRLQGDHESIELMVSARIKEFLGYENEAGLIAAVRRGGETRTMPVPLPKFRLREISTSALVRDGHTLVLSGGTMEEETAPAEPKRALSPKAAAALASTARPRARKILLILLTPTIIDPAGNRVAHARGK